MRAALRRAMCVVATYAVLVGLISILAVSADPDGGPTPSKVVFVTSPAECRPGTYRARRGDYVERPGWPRHRRATDEVGESGKRKRSALHIVRCGVLISWQWAPNASIGSRRPHER
jgi:hypothetical protein